MLRVLEIGDKVRGEYGAEGEITRFSADKMSADVQVMATKSWAVLIAMPISRLVRIETYSQWRKGN